MTFRVSYLVAVLVLLSLGNGQVGVSAAECTDEEQANIDENYDGIEQGIAFTCGTDVCAFSCQDQLTSSVSALPDSTSPDGMNYYQALASNNACNESETTGAPVESACCEDDEALTSEVVESAALGDFGADHPCEAECNAKLQSLVDELPDFSDTNGNNYYQYYLSLINSYSSTTSETTDAPTVTTAAPSTTTAPTTETTTDPTTSTPAPSTDSTASSEATEENETAESSATTAGSASASASKDNGAAAVGGSAVASLVVAGSQG